MPKQDILVIYQGVICKYSTIKWWIIEGEDIVKANKEDIKKWLKQQTK